MIVRIRESKTFKIVSVYLLLNILFEVLNPMQAYALTGGPSQPEFASYTPVGTDEMVDLSSGDLNYNIPLIDVGGYPINVAYSSNVSMDQEASWVGLGWNLSVGQINHNVRGLPDDFKGDKIEYKEYMKPNYTISGSFKITPNIFGKDISKAQIQQMTTGQQNDNAGNVSFGVSVSYNNYNGLEIKPNVGVAKSFNNNVSIGFSAESGKDGISMEPSVSFDRKSTEAKKRNFDLNGKVGCSYNSRQGLTDWSINASRRANANYDKSNIEKTKKSITGSAGGTISYLDPIYTPTVRNGINTETVSFNAALGSEFYGGEAQGQVGAMATYQSILPYNQVREVAAYGYEHTSEADEYSTLDFNREKETSISKNTVNLPVTNYTYDIHSIQGHGISGMYRPYSSKIDYVYDAKSTDLNISINGGAEFGMGNAVHTGFDVGGSVVNGHSGLWDNNAIRNLYRHNTSTPGYEAIYHKNVGELTYESQYEATGGIHGRTFLDAPVRYKVVGIEYYRTLTNKLLDINETEKEIDSPLYRTDRKPRNQFIKHLTFGTLKKLKNTNRHIENPMLDVELPPYAKEHHVGLIEVTKNDGVVYTYGLPAYNLVKNELSFSITGTPDTQNNISYNSDIANAVVGSDRSAFKNLSKNKNLQGTKTPGYVHTHMLTSIKSSDYIDVTNNGFTEDDLGTYTFFKYIDYNKANKNREGKYMWRVPYRANEASYNEGLKTDLNDDQANVVYGEKQLYFVSEIHTKTHVAIFELNDPVTDPRTDGYGVQGIHGGKNANNPSFKLKSIKLYSIAEYKRLKNGEVVHPQKTVHFEYDQSLCQGIANGTEGKLTLKSIYFTYKDSKLGKYSKYKFTYSDNNPNYHEKGYDSWGNYKEYKHTSGRISTEHPYVEQDDAKQDERASAWLLTKVETPTGGAIEINYESDDYSNVQNAKPMRMYEVLGACSASELSSYTYQDQKMGELYTNSKDHREYLIVKVPRGTNAKDHNDFLSTIKRNNNTMQFRFLMNMTKSGNKDDNSNDFDYVHSYCKIKPDECKLFPEDAVQYLAIKMEMAPNEGGLIPGQDNRNPIAVSGWSFARKHLNNYAYRSMDNDVVSENGLEYNTTDIAKQLFQIQTINNLLEVFMGPNKLLETYKVAKKFKIGKSFVRLDDTSKGKKGGGARVSQIKMYDNWNVMLGGDSNNPIAKTNIYGQEYSYVLEQETLNGEAISSGVATYEPAGNKENPFIQPILISTKHMLAPDDDNYMETPYGESFFPSPQVTYRRVSVSSYSNAVNDVDFIKTHKSGHVVTEFYTSYDFPTIVKNTALGPKPKLENLLDNLLRLPIYSKKEFVTSQGYSIILNDMNGKQKSQQVYQEGNSTPISGVEYKYNLADFTNPETKLTTILPDGKVEDNYLGVEIDLVHDFRESKTSSKVISGDANVGAFLFGFFPIVLPTFFAKLRINENLLQTSASTKVVNRFGVLKETIAYENGSRVSTKNLAWDARTGEVLLTQTTDEFEEPYYTLNYPAHWAYDGMGQISASYGYSTYLTQSSDYYTNSSDLSFSTILKEGDEVLMEYKDGQNKTSQKYGWVVNNSGNQVKFMDENGNVLSPGNEITITVIRPARKNLQSAGIMSVTLKQHPLINPTTKKPLYKIDKQFLINVVGAQNNASANYKIINASGVLYSDDWPATCECSGAVSNANKYATNQKGIWRTKASYTYLSKRDYDDKGENCRNNGFFETFNPLYRINAYGKFYYEMSNWTYVSQVSKFAPVGTEIENSDALNRKSSALYGYNNKLPLAVGANTAYAELAYDGFEDYDFNNCIQNNHFSFKEIQATPNATRAHTGKKSIKVIGSQSVVMTKNLKCVTKVKVVKKSTSNDKNCVERKIQIGSTYE